MVPGPNEEFRVVYLGLGEVAFGDRSTRIHTILGSCVSFTLWHPELLIGGMCHYMLANKPKKTRGLDGRYAADAIKLLLNEISARGTSPHEYELKMFGGGNQFESLDSQPAGLISKKNIEIGSQLLTEQGFEVKAQHLGGTGHRKIIFEIATGQVWVRHVELDEP